ncbi:MAG: GTPase domain-containing protein, partial [Desulfobacteraceae bacterium]|nr:GTPase domain-containing protein [Desulfobacteraceae bacterium]
LIVQFNKQDLSNITERKEILERWRSTRLPITFASALHGKGVAETFQKLVEKTYQYLDDVFGLNDRFGIDQSHFTEMIRPPDSGNEANHI